MSTLERGNIRLRNVSRRFKLVHDRSATLKETLIRRRRVEYSELWALREVDLDVRRGEAVAFVGRNGAGKSTLLKVLAGILPPHTGTVETAGQVAAMLELGSGFHPDFTGRENVYMNGALHGLSARDVTNRLGQIVEFAELADFIDMPVRTYSSGMQMRLAFAVAAHVNPDILLLDEVLTVGDAAFQEKCMERIHRFINAGGTLAFVSHDDGAVREVCNRALLIDGGRVLADGMPDEVFEAYEMLLAQGEGAIGADVTPHPGSAKGARHRPTRSSSAGTRVTGLSIAPALAEGTRPRAGEVIDVIVGLRNSVRTPSYFVEIRMSSHRYPDAIVIDSRDCGLTLPRDPGECSCGVTFRLPLQEGVYDVHALVRDAGTGDVIDEYSAPSALVVGRVYGGEGVLALDAHWSAEGRVGESTGADAGAAPRINKAHICDRDLVQADPPYFTVHSGESVTLEVEVVNPYRARAMDLEVTVWDSSARPVVSLHSVDTGIALERDPGGFVYRASIPLPLRGGAINISPALRDIRAGVRIDEWPDVIAGVVTNAERVRGGIAVSATWTVEVPPTGRPPVGTIVGGSPLTTGDHGDRACRESHIGNVAILSTGEAHTPAQFRAGETLMLSVQVANEGPAHGLDLGVVVSNAAGIELIRVHSIDAGLELAAEPGVHSYWVEVPLPLQAGDLEVCAVLSEASTGRHIDTWASPIPIRMIPTLDGEGYVAVEARWRRTGSNESKTRAAQVHRPRTR